jgi:alpha-tubulin suppressor-like RCC1 family protein
VEIAMKDIGWTLLPMLAAGVLVSTLGCREDAESPTAPEPAPVLATAASALAFYQVSTGGYHTCGVTTDNRAYCWGWAVFGQLGNGTTTQRLRPAAVAGTLRFHQVSAGTDHTCGVTPAYRAYCWGINTNGELGDGTTTNRLTPVPVAGGHLFRRVDAGVSHTCGVSYPDNRGYCWGYNNEGELGDGTFTKRLTPVAVTGGRQFRQVEAGYDHTCGVTTSDEAFCWGWNNYGQLGDSSSASFRKTPSRVAGMHRFRQLDAGLDFTCAVTTSDRAFCWGYGRDGQIGDGKTYLRFWPKAVAGGLSFSRVTTGFIHTCGETTLNRAYCWGIGAVGDGTQGPRLTPVAVAGGLYFSQLSAGSGQTCGKTPAGVAYCWGSNRRGELGDGTTTVRYRPTPVLGPM